MTNIVLLTTRTFLRKKSCRAQFQLSFSMIFSIFVIIAILGVGIYAITTFLNIGKCTNLNLFVDDLQNKVDKAWTSTATQDTLELSIPADIGSICFSGNDETKFAPNFEREYGDLRLYLGEGNNLFIHPPKKKCGIEMISYKIDHVNIDRFFCSEVSSGKVQLKISKSTIDPLVRVHEN